MFDYNLVRDARVIARETRDEKNAPIAMIEIDGKYEHTFAPNSRISKALETMNERQLTERLDGGQYFMVGDDLVDFRDGMYTGFIQTDNGIANLVDVLGITDSPRDVRLRRNQVSDQYALGVKWSDHGIAVPGYKEGGQFTSELHFGWNPFEKNVHSALMLVRLICVNGMVGLSSILHTKIPLVNRWEEHLAIANKQIQTKVDGMVTRRVSVMGNERATVAEVLQVADHADVRLNKSKNITDVERTRLSAIARIANPMTHLGKVYRTNVFEDRRLAAQVPGHLTTFDVFNMATEMSTHSKQVDGSSNFALDRLANMTLFDRQDLTAHAARFALPQQSSFSDPDAAFFGQMNV